MALGFAVDHPERVASLTLLAPGLPEVDWSEAIRRFGEQEDAALAAGRLDDAAELNLATWIDRPGLADHRARELRELVGPLQRRAFELARDVDLDAETTPLDTHNLRGLTLPTRVPSLATKTTTTGSGSATPSSPRR